MLGNIGYFKYIFMFSRKNLALHQLKHTLVYSTDWKDDAIMYTKALISYILHYLLLHLVVASSVLSVHSPNCHVIHFPADCLSEQTKSDFRMNHLICSSSIFVTTPYFPISVSPLGKIVINIAPGNCIPSLSTFYNRTGIVWTVVNRSFWFVTRKGNKNGRARCG